MLKVVRLCAFVFISLMVVSSDVYALAVCEMSDEYRDWLALSEEERKSFIEPSYCESTYKNQFTVKSKVYLDEELRAKVTLSRYSAVDDDILTPVKDQGRTNTCWAFATNSLLETASIVEGLGVLDLSEMHLEYAITREGFTDGTKSDGLNRTLDEGGNPIYSSSYYFRHEGPLFENSLPFNGSVAPISLDTMPNETAVLDVDTFGYTYYSNYAACSTNQINSIKEKIVKYGSAGSSMYYSDTYLFSDTYYYFPGNLNANHAVVIVGWDDNIPASLFKHTPNGDGAWIVRNSWGSSFGENGYLYISYSDTKICGNSYYYSGVRVNEYDNAYLASEYMASHNLNLGGDTTYLTARFTKKSEESEYLDKVSLEVTAGNLYEVYISRSNNLNSQSDWSLLGKGTADTDGIVSVKFEPIRIDDDFTIITKRTGTGYYVPMMCASNTSSSIFYQIDIASGKYYGSVDGISWTDTSKLTDYSEIHGCEPVIYAYTKHERSGEATFNIESINPSDKYVYANEDYFYKAMISTSNILSYQLFNLNIYNESGVDVTNMFEIANNISNGNVIIKMNENILEGEYRFKVKYGSLEQESKFVVYSLVTSQKYGINNRYITVSLNNVKFLEKNEFFDNLVINSEKYRILDKNKANITDSVTNIATGMILDVNNIYYTIVLIGDVTGDGAIMSNDALLISRHVVKINSLKDVYLLAADPSKDGAIMSNDALLVSRFVVGMNTSL